MDLDLGNKGLLYPLPSEQIWHIPGQLLHKLLRRLFLYIVVRTSFHKMKFSYWILFLCKGEKSCCKLFITLNRSIASKFLLLPVTFCGRKGFANKIWEFYGGILLSLKNNNFACWRIYLIKTVLQKKKIWFSLIFLVLNNCQCLAELYALFPSSFC